MNLIPSTTQCFKQFNRVELYTKIMKYSPRILASSITQYFEQFGWFQKKRTNKKLSYDPRSFDYSVVQADQLGWTTPNSSNILLWSLFLQLLGSSSSLAMLNYLELVKLCYCPCFFNYSVVQDVQQVWTIHRSQEMFSNDFCSVNYSVVRVVQLDGTAPNSWIIVLWSCFPQLLGNSSSSTGWTT